MSFYVLLIVAWLSLPSPAPAATLLEHFDQYAEGTFPTKWRGKNSDAQSIYRIESEGGNRFLRARSNNQGVQIALERGATGRKPVRPSTLQPRPCGHPTQRSGGQAPMVQLRDKFLPRLSLLLRR